MIFEYPIPYARMRIIVKKDKPVVQKCVHCKKPKCIDVCEHDAIRIENSLVLVDHDKCTGCWECVDVCPFSAIIKDERLNVAIKCDACYGYERLACVSACKVGALMER
jgi:carbon-monoxide dehydrogenase iron sulfur subunit